MCMHINTCVYLYVCLHINLIKYNKNQLVWQTKLK